jgi:hypothetical protein
MLLYCDKQGSSTIVHRRSEQVMRRRALLVILGLSAVLLVCCSRWYYPSLSGDERRLLGNWVTSQRIQTTGYVTARGPVTNPCMLLEFRRDRCFRLWIISADDPDVSILHKEGQWSAGNGRLHIGGFGRMKNALREAREQIRMKFGSSYVGRGDMVLHSMRFVNPDTWELTTLPGKSIIWRRRS